MKLLDTILLGLDFAEPSANTIQSAFTLAKKFESKIIPIHVLPNDIANEKVAKLLKETATEKLKEIEKQIAEKNIQKGASILKYGSPIEAISSAIVSSKSSILVIGAGDSKKQKFKLGITTAHIIQKSEKPVFVIKDNAPLSINQILCPVDFSNTSKRALTNAIIIAKKFKAKLVIISVCEIENSSWILSTDALENENTSRIEKHSKKFHDFLKEFHLSGLEWQQETLKGNPAQEILKALANHQIDLLVIGTSGRTGLNRLIIGSVTEKVIREVPCSFLTLKSEDAFSVKLETTIKDLDHHYNEGLQLMNDGFYEEALSQFQTCLNINSMHIISYLEAAKALDHLKNPEKAAFYRQTAIDLKEKLWFHKIEEEVRKHRGI